MIRSSRSNDRGTLQQMLTRLFGWLDSSNLKADPAATGHRLDPARLTPYIVVHAACFGVIWVGWSWAAVATAIALYVVRMFAITGFYHRYFSHRTFRTSRAAQFVFAVLGNSAAQRGPLWWASQHRKHHSHSDDELDPHSPHEHGFYWSHFGWLTERKNLITDMRAVRDLAQFPELRFLDRFEMIVPAALAVSLFVFGEVLRVTAPALQTSGLQMVVWGFFISTVVLFHCTCFINSLAHLVGTRRYQTTDESRNNWLLALLTLGEGWHNNHHRYPSAVRQGFYWWEIDLTYYGLKLLERLGLIWNLRAVPAHVLASGATRRVAA